MGADAEQHVQLCMHSTQVKYRNETSYSVQA